MTSSNLTPEPSLDDAAAAGATAVVEVACAKAAVETLVSAIVKRLAAEMGRTMLPPSILVAEAARSVIVFA